MNEIVCVSFFDMIEKYVNHLRIESVDHKFLSNDQYKRLLIGFSCCDELYLFRLTDLRRRKMFPENTEVSEHCRAFLESQATSSEKRVELANTVDLCVKTSVKDLERYFELKAFW